MREEVIIDNHIVAVDISLWTCRIQIEVDGKRIFNSWKILYISIISAIIATILLIIGIIIWYDLGYMMGKDGAVPLFPITFT